MPDPFYLRTLPAAMERGTNLVDCVALWPGQRSGGGGQVRVSDGHVPARPAGKGGELPAHRRAAVQSSAGEARAPHRLEPLVY
eukprot:1138401-Pyramimonas_sp.AAC.1